MAWYDVFRAKRSVRIEYDPESGLTRESWEGMPEELRAVLPWNVYGNEDAGTKTNSGNYVSEDSAFKMGVVFAAVTLISDGVASLPPKAFTLAEDGNRVEQPLPQWIRSPHPEVRRFDIMSQLMVSLLTWGNGYARFIRRPSDGVIVGLQILDPADVTTEWDPNKPGYRRYKISGNGQWLTAYDIFHVQGPTLPGDAEGMSVIKYAREAIGLGITLEEYGARYFGQGSQAKIVLEIPSQIDEPKAKDIVRTFERFHRGKNNWHRPAIVSGGAKLHQISIPPDDAQFLQSRDFQAIEIARWFRVPPHRVGIVSKSTSWGSGLAEENMAMLQHTYRPWIIRLQDALSAYAPGAEGLGTMIELDTAALLGSTFKELSDIWVGLYEKDVVTKNEARLQLGLQKTKDGDKFFSESQPDPAAQAPVTSADKPGEGGRTKEDDRIRKQEEASRFISRIVDDIDYDEIFGEDRAAKSSGGGGNPHHDPKSGKFTSKSGLNVTGMSEATPERKAEFKEKIGKAIPPAWTDVHIANDLDNAQIQVIGRDAKGRRQAWYSKKHTEAQAEKKFTRIKELSKHTDKLDSALDRDALTNDDAGALTLIRRLGMRPGSNADRGASVQAHGATNLKAKHVTLNKDGTANLNFTGKDGVQISLHIKDKKSVDVLSSRKIGKGDDDQLFNTNEDRVRNYMHSEGGVPKGFMLKDMRTLKANTAALDHMSTMEPPKSQAEFKKKRREVGEVVSAQLGNEPTMALNSYINPTVFGQWNVDGSWSA